MIFSWNKFTQATASPKIFCTFGLLRSVGMIWWHCITGGAWMTGLLKMRVVPWVVNQCWNLWLELNERDASWTGGRHLWGDGVPEVGDLLVHSSKRLVTMVRNQKLRRVDCLIFYVAFWVGRLWVQTVCQQQSWDKWHLLLMFIKFLRND